MKNRLAIALTLLMAGFMQAEAQISVNCTLTYEQGYNVGRSLGSSETYWQENYQAYRNTITDFGNCVDYALGVEEAYFLFRFVPDSRSGRTGCDPTNGDCDPDIPERYTITP